MVSKIQIQFTPLGKVVPVEEIFQGLRAAFSGFSFSSIKQCLRCVFSNVLAKVDQSNLG